MRGARLLTLLGGKRRYRTSSFANWTPVVGAAADGVATALADWGLNLVANGEFSEDTAGWGTQNGAIISRVDSIGTPGVQSPGSDAYSLRVTSGGAITALATISPYIANVPGATLRGQVYAYAPSANTQDNAARLRLYDGTVNSQQDVSAEDVWQDISLKSLAFTETPLRVWLYCASETDGDVAYYDGVRVYRQTAPLLSPHRAASGVWTWGITQPASGVVPWSALVRYLDASNYWEVRTKPNTDGNDLELVEVVAGVETTRAAADVDWTAEQTDELRITARGTTIGVEHRKHGEAVWTAGLSYASATAHQTAGQYGQMQWEIGEKRAASVRWDK